MLREIDRRNKNVSKIVTPTNTAAIFFTKRQIIGH